MTTTDTASAAPAWGIMATGKIARSFATNLRSVPGARLVAVGSRSESSAAAFAAEFGVAGARAHGSYAGLAQDPDVDIVYVASPHALHLEHARLALEAGKHVLCEKALALNLHEAEQMIALAREHDRFLMEAMWMTCHPVIRAVADDLAAGRFGRPRQLHADLGFVVGERAPGDRLVDPTLGASALLDMGIYPLTLADLLLGPAEELHATAALAPSGYDTDVAVTGRHASGALSALTASMTSASPRTATLATDLGRLELPADFHHPPYAVWCPTGADPQRIDPPEPVLGTGLGNEAAEVMRCVAAGLRESPLVPHDRTLRLMRQMDQLRRQVGVRYAADEA